MARPSRWDEVVAVAARLFREKGYATTSLEDIASELGMLKGSLYHYIDGKEDLLLAVVRPPADRLILELRGLVAMDLPASEKIRRFVHSQVNVLEEYFPYVAVYVTEIAGRHRSEHWADLDHEYVVLIEKVLQEGVEGGLLESTLPTRTAAFALIGSINWMTRWYRPRGPSGPDEIADQIANLFLAGALSRSVR